MSTPVLFYDTVRLITDDIDGIQSRQVVRALDNGGWVAGWVEEADEGSSASHLDAYVRVFNEDATFLTSEIRVNQTETGDQWLVDVVNLADDTFVALWTSYGQDIATGDRGLYLRHFDADGTALGDERLVLNQSGLPSYNIKATALADGGFVLLANYLGGSPFSMSRMVFDGNLDPVGAPELLSSVAPRTADRISVETLAEGGHIAAWIESGTDDLLVQRFGSDGAVLGDKITVSTDALSYDWTGRPTFPDVDTLKNGGFVVTWSELSDAGDRDVLVRAYDSEGTAGLTFDMPESEDREQSHSSVTHLLDGGYLVAYVDQATPNGEPGGHYDRIAMQRFNADGTPYGDAFVYSDFYDENDTIPQLELLSDGRVTVSFAIEAFGVGGDTFLEISDIAQQILAMPKEGTEGDDVLEGGEGAKFLLGLEGDDFLIGGATSDYLSGGAGNDTMFGAGGSDTFIGGEGLDVVDYNDSTDAIELDFTLQTVSGFGDDIIVDVEHVIASDHDDTITGDAFANAIIGSDGGDSIAGGAGGDLLFGDGVSAEDLLAVGLTIEDIFLLA